ncbi:hypothetical protein P3S67_030524 [Capsicum chacoense]
MKIPRIWHEDPPSIVHALRLTVLHFLYFSLINLIYPKASWGSRKCSSSSSSDTSDVQESVTGVHPKTFGYE